MHLPNLLVWPLGHIHSLNNFIPPIQEFIDLFSINNNNNKKINNSFIFFMIKKYFYLILR